MGFLEDMFESRKREHAHLLETLIAPVAEGYVFLGKSQQGRLADPKSTKAIRGKEKPQGHDCFVFLLGERIDRGDLVDWGSVGGYGPEMWEVVEMTRVKGDVVLVRARQHPSPGEHQLGEQDGQQPHTSDPGVRLALLKVLRERYDIDPHDRVFSSHLAEKLGVEASRLKAIVSYLGEKGLVTGYWLEQGEAGIGITAKGIDFLEAQGHPSIPALGRPSEEEFLTPTETRANGRGPERDLSLGIEHLHPKVIEKCEDLLRSGHFDHAVEDAFKLVETYVRDAICADQNVFGVDLMSKALGGEDPPLRISDVKAEQEGVHLLFRGAIAAFKNPHSHRFVPVQHVAAAMEHLAFVSLLLRLVDQAKAPRTET